MVSKQQSSAQAHSGAWGCLVTSQLVSGAVVSGISCLLIFWRPFCERSAHVVSPSCVFLLCLCPTSPISPAPLVHTLWGCSEDFLNSSSNTKLAQSSAQTERAEQRQVEPRECWDKGRGFAYCFSETHTSETLGEKQTCWSNPATK